MAHTHTMIDDHHHSSDAMDVYGFWIYILSDCLLFGTIFSVYASLSHNLYGGVSLKQLIDLPYIFIETMALLASSFTCGLAILGQYRNNAKQVVLMLALTFLLGAVFVGMELNEFVNLYNEGHSWQVSAAMSAFFTLVGTHGLHVSMGLLWLAVTIIQVMVFGLNPMMKRRLTYFAMFWAFLDIVWIFVFTVVYLMGAI